MAYNPVYRNWSAPDFHSLDFGTNCTLVGLWSNAWWSSNAGVNDNVIGNYFRAALPQDLKNIPTRGQLVDWYHFVLQYGLDHQYQNGSDPFMEVVINQPYYQCPKEYCAAAPYEGSPEVTGIGILTSYYVQATLATLFLIFVQWDFWSRRNKQRHIRPRLQLLIDAIKATIDIFETAVEVITLSIVIATIVIAANKSPTRDRNEIILGSHMAMFSTISMLLLLWTSEVAFVNPSRKQGRWLVCGIVLLLYVAESWFANLTANKIRASYYQYQCHRSTYDDESRTAFGLSMVYLGIYFAWVLIFYLLPSIGSKAFPKLTKWTIAHRKYSSVIGTLFLGVIMWGHLINVTIARQRIIHRTNKTNADTKWTFGQVVALFTWMPILVELYYLLRKGIQAALQERVPDPWIVQKFSNIESAVPDVNTTTTNEDQEDQELLPVSSSNSQHTSQVYGRSSYQRLSGGSQQSADRHSIDLTAEAPMRHFTY